MEAHEQAFKDAIMVRTYSRVVESENRKESPDEVFTRVLDAFEEYYIEKYPFINEYYNRDKWFAMMKNGIALPAGRMLWSMGSRTIKEEGFLSLMNCSFVVVDDPVTPVLFAMKMLILGCGVGFSLERKYMSKTAADYETVKDAGGTLTEVTTELTENIGQTYMVRDSKEGWIDFMRQVLCHAICGNDLCFSLRNLRPAGSPIRGFGGISGDPRKLAETARKIWNAIIHSPTATVSLYYDIICWIAELVISGNVRRSALIAIGDPDDEEFLSLKKFDYIRKWNATQRFFCNNSVNIREWSDLGEKYWETFIAGEGEPYGWVNVGKCIDTITPYKPEGFNPCGEQPLASKEVCCLGEINVQKIETGKQLKNALRMVYLFCKLAYTLGAPTEPTTEKICHANQRIGISMTGISMIAESVFIRMAKKGKMYLKSFDDLISVYLGVNKCCALTTVKPGGTLPKIAGSSGPGIHLPISEYQIRRVRFSKRCSLIPWLSRIGVPVEADLTSPDDTVVASFYIRNGRPYSGVYSDSQITKDGFEDMLTRIVVAQEYWSENSVSVTLYYDPTWSVEQLKESIKEFQPDLKSLSCLPYYGHNFKQAPEEPISREEYERVASKLPAYEKPPLDIDGIHLPEDFGGCTVDGGCSDR